MKKSTPLTPRDYLKMAVLSALNPLVLAIRAAGYSFLIEPQRFQVETVRLRLPRLAREFSGLRVAQLSDIHMGGWIDRARLQQVSDLVVAERPDLLLITGDFLLGHEFTEASQQSVKDLVQILSPLAASIPSFAVLGNHDYWTDAGSIRQMLRSCGIKDLTNAVHTLERNGECLHLCGVDDVSEGEVRLDAVLEQLSEEGAAILMAHEPDFADTSAATRRFDLQLSGHTHGGQVILPLLGPPVLPFLGRKYPRGLYKVGEMFQYTNRGLGMANLPVRINCLPEITIFVLDSGRK
jgi:predicted MPP superfamily phosphohydrolase